MARWGFTHGKVGFHPMAEDCLMAYTAINKPLARLWRLKLRQLAEKEMKEINEAFDFFRKKQGVA